MIKIIGCARSGTEYTAKVLQNIGVDVRHEELGADGIIDWRLTKPGPQTLYPFPVYQDVDFDLILHQTRNPLDVIRGCFVLGHKSKLHLQQTGFFQWGNTLFNWMYYWYHWNLLAEKQAKITYKIGCLQNDKCFDFWCMDIIGTQTNFKARDNVSRTQNHRPNGLPPVTWKTLTRVDKALALNIRELASKYGYAG